MNLKTLFRWHLWLGLISGLFMFLVGMTGAVAVFIEEIDWLATPGLRATAMPDGARVEANTVLAAVRAAYPDARITSVRISERPRFSHTVTVQTPPRGSLQVFVDPYSAEIKGTRTSSSAYTATVRNFIRQSHVRLLMGLWGRVFVGIIGVVLVLSCITGLWIYRGWIKKMFKLHLTGGWRNRPAWAELHKFIGVWSLLFNLVIGLTGAVLGLENLTGQIKRHWLTPPPSAKAVQSKPVFATGTPLNVDQLLVRAQEVFPDLAVRSIDLPNRPNVAATLRGDVPSILMMQSHVRRASSLALDPVSGAVINKIDGREATGWRRLYFTFDPLHFGYFGGMTTKVIWFILGLTPGVLAVTGTLMWWRRKARLSKKAPAQTEASSAGTKGSSAVRWIPLLIGAATLIGSYSVLAQHAGSWEFTHRLAEHWLVKPGSLALVAFPITGLLCWLAYRWRTHLVLSASTWLALGLWYVLLSGLFLP